jgi:phosphatidylinositol kinase/protein kinase (PI-3  family)
MSLLSFFFLLIIIAVPDVMLTSNIYGEICRVMNGINAPKVVECLGSDGRRYRQLAKSGNDDLRQDAVRI